MRLDVGIIVLLILLVSVAESKQMEWIKVGKDGRSFALSGLSMNRPN